MNGADFRRQSTVSSSGSSGGNPTRRRYSRTSSADSIFEDISVKATNLFAHLDEERKGYLDVGVLAKACESRLNERQLSDLVSQMDQDGDGRVSVEDFRRCLRRIARRNSMIRASLRNTTTVARAPVSAQNSNSSTSSESNRSRLNSDDATSSEVEERGLNKSIRRPTGAFKPIRTRERNKDRLISRLTSNAEQLRGSSELNHTFSTSLPELTSVDECLATLKCHEHIYELYHLLLSENPSLSRMYESVLVDVVDFVQTSKQMHSRIEQQIESERAQHTADILRLSEELDQQVQMAEESARTRERELALAEFQSQLEAKTAKVNQLMERLKQMEEQNNLNADISQNQELIDSRLENLQNEVRQLRFEKTRLEDILTSTRAQLYQTRTELATMRQTFNEKSRELDSHIATFVEVVKENSNLKRQLSLLQEVNRELCDANDGLCAVLESSAEEVSQSASLREANTACALIFSNFRQMLTDYQSPLIESTQKLIGEEAAESATELQRHNSLPCEQTAQVNQVKIHDNTVRMRSTPGRRKRRSEVLTAMSKQQKSQDCLSYASEPGLESLHEDSGLSSLRDAPEFESEMEVDSPVSVTHGTRVAQPAYHLQEHLEQTDAINSTALPTDPLTIPTTLIDRQFSSPATVTTTVKPRFEAASSTPDCPPGLHSTVDEKMRIFRVMLAGDSDVGKTSLLIRLCDNVFTGTSVSTIGIDMKMRSMNVDGRSAMLQLWDTAGQERFRSLSSGFYRKADGILLVYDCTSEFSFIHTREWINTIQENAGREMPVAIIGNKVDLREQRERQGAQCVGYTAGRKFAQEIGALFFETSALTGLNVEECVNELTRLLCAQEDYNLRRPHLKLSNSEKPKSSNCCAR